LNFRRHREAVPFSGKPSFCLLVQVGSVRSETLFPLISVEMKALAQLVVGAIVEEMNLPDREMFTPLQTITEGRETGLLSSIMTPLCQQPQSSHRVIEYHSLETSSFSI